jgi:hypothetical protein
LHPAAGIDVGPGPRLGAGKAVLGGLDIRGELVGGVREGLVVQAELDRSGVGVTECLLGGEDRFSSGSRRLSGSESTLTTSAQTISSTASAEILRHLQRCPAGRWKWA